MSSKKRKPKTRTRWRTKVVTEYVDVPGEADTSALHALLEEVYQKGRVLAREVLARRSTSVGMVDVKNLALFKNARALAKASRYMAQAAGVRRALKRV